MEELSRLYFQFFNQFATAYPDGAIPAETNFPYIVYSVIRPEWGGRTIMGISIYDRSTGFARIRSIGTAIAEAIPQSGTTLELENGKGIITLYRGSPFIQSRTLPDDEVRENIISDYVNIEILAHIF